MRMRPPEKSRMGSAVVATVVTTPPIFSSAGPVICRKMRIATHLIIMHASVEGLADRFRVSKGKKFRLKDFDPADTGKLKSADKAARLLEQTVELLSDLQEKL